MTTYPPDDRLDGAVHTWFGLSYSNYAVLHRTLMQSMPEEWQERIVACLQEIEAAFHHIERAECYEITPAVECEYGSLNEWQRKRLQVIPAWLGRGATRRRVFYDRDGTEHDPDELALVPAGDDPVPHYNRGRTYIEPQLGGAQ